MAWINKGHAPENVAKAHRCFDRALIADPGNVDALVGSARADAVDGINLFGTDPAAALAAAEVKLMRALSSVPDHPRGHMWLGLVYLWTKRAPEGIAKCERALELDRNLAEAHANIGFGKIFIGRAEEAEAHVAEGLRLSPRDVDAYKWMGRAGLANLHLSCWESRQSPGIGGQSRPTEISRISILCWAPPSRSLAVLMRPVRQSRPVSLSTRLSPSSVSTPLGRR
jgi:tetratricopeptide (TPR) repeat protein